MSRVNLHLFLSPIRNESRLAREARATSALGLFDRVVVLGIWEKDLKEKEMIWGILEVVRVKTLGRRIGARWPELKRGVLTKCIAAISYVQYCLASWILAMRVRPTYVSCHNLMLLPVACTAAWLCGAGVIYEPHELELERTGLRGLVRVLSAPVERGFIGMCRAVVVVCEPIASWYRQRYAIDNVHVIRSIPEVPVSGVELVSWRESIRASMGIPPEAIVFIYQGVLGRERGIDELLAIFQQDSIEHHLLLMGYGEAEPRILVAAKACGRIHFQPSVAMDDIIKFTSSADVGLHVIQGVLSLSYQYSLPNKFFEYLAAGLPIVVSANLVHLSEIVTTHGLGWAVEPGQLLEFVSRFDRTMLCGFSGAISKYGADNNWVVEKQQYIGVYLPR